MLKSKWIRAAMISTAVFSLAACTNNQGAANNNATPNPNMRPYSVDQNHMNGDVNRRNGVYNNLNRNPRNVAPLDTNRSRAYSTDGVTQLHNNTRVALAKDLADKVAAMKEVKRANVLVTDHNAYVAVVLHRNANRTNTVAPNNMNNYRNNTVGNNGMNYKNNAIRNNGTNVNNNGTNVNNNNVLGNNFNDVRGNHLGTYSTTDGVTDDLKTRIANKIQAAHPAIKNVYVSANADFVNRMNGFVDQIQAGRPVQGFMSEFNAIVGRVFPTKADTDMNRTGTTNNMGRTTR